MVTNKRKISQKLDIPDDWKEQASDTFTQVSEKWLMQVLNLDNS